MTPEEAMLAILNTKVFNGGMVYFDTSSAIKTMNEVIREARNAALEEAAKVAEEDNNHCGKRIAAAIRALHKDEGK